MIRRIVRGVARRVARPMVGPARRQYARLYPRLMTERRLLAALQCESIDALWTQQLRAPFFLRPDMREEWTKAYRTRYPELLNEPVEAAERALRHEFDLLGSGPTVLGWPLPWHDDFKAQKRWPLNFSPDIQYLELDRPTDVKVPWELSRCQHFTALGRGFWLTGDERFAQEFVAEVSDWIATNPWGFGVNWACAMDVALRAVSWIWGFYFMGASRACESPQFRASFMRALYLHGEYVATHLERGAINGNHYLSDGVGLVFLGVFFRNTAAGRRWLATGMQIVVDEIEAQTSSDGVDFEQATAYHRLVLELFLTAYLLLEDAGEAVPAGAWARLERMLEFVAGYTKPDGLAPLIGDADDGRVQKLGSQALNDHRYLLAIGAVRFGRADFKRAAVQFWDEAFWLLGPDGAKRFDAGVAAPEEPRSRAFASGGVFVLRNRSAHVVIDCAEVGMRGHGGHGHNDCLSFELWMNGANLVTDCGSYVYSASREWRNKFRSTAFHNTVEVDGEEINRFVGPDALWQLRNDARPVGRAWMDSAAGTYFRGAHTGYERLTPPVSVAREWFLPASGGALVVRDRVTGGGRRTLTWRFHFDPAVVVDVADDAVRLRAGESETWMHAMHASSPLNLQLEAGWVSPSYGVRTPTHVAIASLQTDLPYEVTWIFGPRAVGIAADLIDDFNRSAATAAHLH